MCVCVRSTCVCAVIIYVNDVMSEMYCDVCEIVNALCVRVNVVCSQCIPIYWYMYVHICLCCVHVFVCVLCVCV